MNKQQIKNFLNVIENFKGSRDPYENYCIVKIAYAIAESENDKTTLETLDDLMSSPWFKLLEEQYSKNYENWVKTKKIF